jgi:heme exporter protein CcmC
MSASLLQLQPYFFMSKTRSYAKILIGSRLFLTAMAIHLSLRVSPLDLQQGGNSRIPYVHVPAARMSILVYIATAINTFLFLLTKKPLFLRSSGTGTEIGAFSTLFTLVTGGFRGRPMWGTFRVWDARLTSVFISFLIYLGALRFQKLPVEPAPISIRAGPIDIPIIKSSVNWWNTSHQPGSISRSGTSIHVPMPIPILSNFANSPFSTRILFVLETRLPIPSFLESLLTEEIEAREGIPKPSSLAESLSIHGGMVKAPNLYKRKIRRFDSCWMHLELKVQSLLTEFIHIARPYSLWGTSLAQHSFKTSTRSSLARERKGIDD